MSFDFLDGAYSTNGSSTESFTVPGNGEYILAVCGQTQNNGPVQTPTNPSANAVNFQVINSQISGFDAAAFYYFEITDSSSTVTFSAGWSFRCGMAVYQASSFDPADTDSWLFDFEDKNHQGSEWSANIEAGDGLIMAGTTRETDADYRNPGPDWTATLPDYYGTVSGFQSSFISENFASADATFMAGWASTVQSQRDVAGFLQWSPPVDTGEESLPGAGGVSGAGAQPTVSAGASVTGVGTAAGVGTQPTVSTATATEVLPGAGSATGQGAQPTVSAGASASTGTGSGAGSGAGSGLVPLVAANSTTAPSAGSATGQGAAPSVSVGGAFTANPGDGLATGQGSQPSIAASVSISAGDGAAVGVGRVALVAVNVDAAPSAGAASGQGAGPDVSVGGGVLAQPINGSADGVGASPDVSADAATEASTGVGAGQGLQPFAGGFDNALTTPDTRVITVAMGQRVIGIGPSIRSNPCRKRSA